MFKIAILASGNGSNAQAIMDRAASGALRARVSLVIANRPGAHVLERAANAGVPHLLLDHRQYAGRESYDRALAAAVMRSGADAVALAGYMRLLGGVFLETFGKPVLNLHPALLPCFPGLHGAADALAYGVKITGPSVHFVDEGMDTGPLIIQAATGVVAGEPLESLQARIHMLEHRIYPQALQWLAEGRLETRGRSVFLSAGSARKLPQEQAFFAWPELEEGF